MWSSCPTNRGAIVALIVALGASRSATAAESPERTTPSPAAVADAPASSVASSAEPTITPPVALTLEIGQIRSVAVLGVTRVAIGDPAVLDVTVVSANELLLRAAGTGTTNLLIWDQHGQRAFAIEVGDRKQAGVEEELRHLLLELHLTGVTVTSDKGRLFLLGDVATQADLDRVEQLLSAYKEHVTNLVRVASKEITAAAAPKSVRLTIQLIEMSRDASNKIGVDWSDSQTITETAFSAVGPTATSLGRRLNQAFRVGSLSRNGASAVVNFLVSQGKARILAEPKLVAASGKQATASLGTEVPVITATSVSSGTVSQNIEFKKTGVELKFTPTVLENGRAIQLVLDTKVSSIDKTSAITVSGITVPGFKVRHATTELVADAGDSVFIAGLLQEEEKKNLSQVPAIGSIPILGNLFRSNEFSLGHTELIILVTPDLLGPEEADAGDKTAALDEALTSAELSTTEQDPILRYALQVRERIVTSLPAMLEGGSVAPGQVKLRLHLFRDGRLGEVVVAEPSGNARWDTEAVETAKQQSPYPSFPAEFGQPDLWLEVPVLFRP